MPDYRHDPPNAQAPAESPPLPDLFGHVPPASASVGRTDARRAAEWPAAGATRPARTVPVYGAADRPLESAPVASGSLAGTYDRRGSTLRRDDGVALTVCTSKKPRTGRRADRYVRKASPGAGVRYAGTLYDDAATLRCDLDGCQFQDRDTRTRYRLDLVAPDRYAVAVVASRRRGRNRS